MTASAALLLNACGSGGGGHSSTDKAKGADGGNGRISAAPFHSASQGGAGRPEITLSKEFEADFQNWTNSDPKLQAVLNDGGEELKSEYAAIVQGNPDSKAVAFYNSDATLVSAGKWIKQFTDE